MSVKKPSHGEDEFIARQEAVERYKAAIDKSHELNASEKEQLRELHYMKCPKCGMDLHPTVFRGITIDKCYSCNGTWLDANELETLAGHGSDVLRHVVDFFRR